MSKAKNKKRGMKVVVEIELVDGKPAPYVTDGQDNVLYDGQLAVAQGEEDVLKVWVEAIEAVFKALNQEVENERSLEKNNGGRAR